jgi:PTS system mannose-specific IIA component
MTKTNKIGGIIVSHGQIANELLAAAEGVVGDLSHIRAVSIGGHDDVDMAKAEIKRAIAHVSQGSGVLILTDMFGGTPTNIAAMFFRPGEVEIVTGVNLSMVIKLATINREMTLEQFAKEVEDEGKEAITRAGVLLAPQKMKKEA